MRRFFMVLLAILLLTGNAQAVKENEVFDLVDQENIMALKDIDNAEDYSPDELEVYYSENFNQNSADECMQLPKLNDNEKARVADIQKAWESGKRSLNSILNKTDNVVVGVYELKAQDFKGEKAYTLLPNRMLTDEEILSIIDAFESLNLKFNPDNLNYKNCARGGGVETNRYRRKTEEDRMKTLSELYKRNDIKPKNAFTALPNDDGNGEILVDIESYNGMDRFSFKPYREMTDEELLQIISNNVGEIFAGAALGDYENITRQELHRVLNAPISIKLTDESRQIAGKSNVFLNDIEVYCASFEGIGEDNIKIYYYAMLDISNGSLYYALSSCISGEEKQGYADLHGDPYDKHWKTVINNIIKEMRNDKASIEKIEAKGEYYDSSTGFGVYIYAYMEDKSCYQMQIRYQDDSLKSVIYYRDTPDPYDAYKEEMQEVKK